MDTDLRKPTWKQKSASLFAISAIALGFAIRIKGGGWLLIPLFIPYVAFALFSLSVLVVVGLSGKPANALTLATGIAGFWAFVFQVDYGDGGPVWFAIDAAFHSDATRLTPVPSWWFTNGGNEFSELSLFVPAGVILLYILVGQWYQRQLNRLTPSRSRPPRNS